jgi:hypothetical protein
VAEAKSCVVSLFTVAKEPSFAYNFIPTVGRSPKIAIFKSPKALMAF